MKPQETLKLKNFPCENLSGVLQTGKKGVVRSVFA
jgi:hypothetical protein